MPFFFPQQQPQASLAAERQEMDIFQLLSLLDSSSPQYQPRRQHKPAPTFIPNFDILETASAYELFGEVPGLNVQTLDIQFEDAQTVVLKGRTDRPSASAPTAVEEKVQEKEIEHEVETATKNATVEDAAEEDYDEVDTPLTSSTIASPTATAAPAVKPVEKKETPAPAAPKSRFWLTERKTGSFARSFSFAQRIEIDDVTAELKEGVLHVVVPKSVKSRKVAVSVN